MNNEIAQSRNAAEAAVTAIDILLVPDATMLSRSEANNARLRREFPKGFALDAAHLPHVTLVQCFVRTAELESVYAAVGRVIERSNVAAIRLEAFKYDYIPGGDIGLAGIVARPTPELLVLQSALLVAVSRFTERTGDSSAFHTTPDDPVIDPQLIAYVSAFEHASSGEHFDPHVTTGVAPRKYLDRMLAEPFEKFTISCTGAAVYQLGQFGTAARKLKEWKLQS